MEVDETSRPNMYLNRPRQVALLTVPQLQQPSSPGSMANPQLVDRDAVDVHPDRAGLVQGVSRPDDGFHGSNPPSYFRLIDLRRELASI